MKSHLVVLRGELQALRRQLEIAQSALDIADTSVTRCDPPPAAARLASLRSLVGENATEFRVHQYRSTVVSLYGSLERFVESLADEAAQRVGELASNYTDLSQPFRDSHLRLTLELIQRKNEPRYQGTLSESDLIARLHSCLQGEPGFTLNSRAFAYHSANFRHDVVKEVLGRAEVKVQSVDHASRLSAMMSEKFPDLHRYEIVNDLAQRRNDVSHGQTGPILSFPLLFDYIDVIEAYAEGLVGAAIGGVAAFALPSVGLSLGRPDKVFRNEIAGFLSIKHSLVVGDVLGYRRGDGRCGIGQILSLQVNGGDRPSVAAGESVGVRTHLRCSVKTEVFRLPASLVDLESEGLDSFL